ncbi:MAG TPA: DUF4062 domain-containing protein [Longimicrobium sp.]|nr:DUF4062 domain-containing protein [Longimicrobium sp.]
MKPRIFISSTIYDFRDLRSALKHWLEALGFEVMLSEFNDFTKPLDVNSYQACLEAIGRAQYFVLLVGSRTGGFYNKAESVTITRKEFQTAYELFGEGKLKLLTFVRTEVWNLRDDRKALERLLRDEYQARFEIPDDEVKRIARHGSTIVNDANVTFDFLGEIGRLDQMKAAVAGQAPLPRGNWIHQFSTFGEILDALRVEFGIADNMNRAVLVENLKREIESNVRSLVSRAHTGQIRGHFTRLSIARARYAGSVEHGSVYAPHEVQAILAFMNRGFWSGLGLSTRTLDQAVLSGEFLEHDLASGTAETTYLHELLVLLGEEISRLRRIYEYSVRDDWAKLYDQIEQAQNGATIPNLDLLAVMSAADRQENILHLARRLYQYLHGEPAPAALTLPRDPSPLDPPGTAPGGGIEADQLHGWMLSSQPA